jgi:hypothetical protein
MQSPRGASGKPFNNERICVMTLRKLYLMMLMMAGLVTLQACDSNDGPLEDAAEEIDDAADDIGDDIDDALD